MIRDLLERRNREAVAGIIQASESTRAQWIKDLLAKADAWKPDGFRDACEQLADYYRGDQARHLLAHLKHAFPDTWERLPRNMTLPVLRRWIDQQATVYQTPPARTLADAEGEPIDEAADDGQAFAELQRGAGLWEAMQELDRAVTLYGSALLLFGWNDWRGQTTASVVPPHLAHIVPDHDDPADLSRAWAVLIELASADGINGNTRRFLVYWRDVEQGQRQPWQAAVIHENGYIELADGEDAQDLTAPVKNELGQAILPAALVQREPVHGAIYPRPPVDLIQAQDAVNETWVDIHARARLSGFGSYVASLQSASENTLALLNLAPGGVSIVEPEESVAAITTDSRLAEHVGVLQDYLLQQAQRLGLPPSSWSPKDRPNLSGVALKVENLESELHRARQINRFERLEEGDLFDIARAVWNTYAVPAGQPAIGWDLKLIWRPGQSTIPTDEEAQRRVLDHDVSKNWLTTAQAMARALSISEQEAVERLASNVDANRAQIRPAGVGLAEAALAIADAPGLADEG